MPSGRLHDRLTLWSLPWLGGFSLLLTRNAELTLYLCGGFLFSGLMFGPDLDIYSRQYQRWGILRSLWLPYRACFSHRSWLTHGPVIGTLIRVVYLGVWLLLLASLAVLVGGMLGIDREISVEWVRKTLSQLWQNYRPQILALGLGLELGSLSHIIPDALASAALKKKRKRGGRPSKKGF